MLLLTGIASTVLTGTGWHFKLRGAVRNFPCVQACRSTLTLPTAPPTLTFTRGRSGSLPRTSASTSTVTMQHGVHTAKC